MTKLPMNAQGDAVKIRFFKNQEKYVMNSKYQGKEGSRDSQQHLSNTMNYYIRYHEDCKEINSVIADTEHQEIF